MNDRLAITEESKDAELTSQMAKFRLNGEWLTSQGAELFEEFPGKYLAISEGEVFVADDASEARRLAKARHPDDEPFVQFVPRECRERIYAY